MKKTTAQNISILVYNFIVLYLANTVIQIYGFKKNIIYLIIVSVLMVIGLSVIFKIFKEKK